MTIQSLLDAMSTIAPLSLAESWDRVGLQLGRSTAPLTGPILLTIDLTEAVLDEAIANKASAIIAYHPPIWTPLSKLTSDSPGERVLLRAAESHIAIYSPHTALDAASGGINDWLCEGLSDGASGTIAGDCRSLTPLAQQPASQQLKIVTFLPAKEADRVRSSLATAGAGTIGNYTVCSFAAEGTGTFIGDETTSPAVGSPGQLERHPEVRLEMVVSKKALPLALETLRQFHPYEEPAIDVYELVPQPVRGLGVGRRLVLDEPANVGTLADRLKSHLSITTVSVALPPHIFDSTPISHIAICAGAGASLVQSAIDNECQLFITGELKHHEVLAALKSNIGVMLAGHTNTERGYLHRLAPRIESSLPGIKCIVSSSDRDPLRSL